MEYWDVSPVTVWPLAQVIAPRNVAAVVLRQAAKASAVTAAAMVALVLVEALGLRSEAGMVAAVVQQA